MKLTATLLVCLTLLTIALIHEYREDLRARATDSRQLIPAYGR